MKLQAVEIAAVDNAVEELEYFKADLSNLAGANAAKGQIDPNRISAQIFIVDLSCKYESDVYNRICSIKVKKFGVQKCSSYKPDIHKADTCIINAFGVQYTSV